MMVFAYFHGGPGGALDKAARHIFDGHNGRSIGAGMMMDTGERDIQYDVPDEQVEQCKAALEGAGFRVRVEWKQ